MRIMVTGSTGFLGRRVVKTLSAQGHQVRCLVHIPGREAIFHDEELDIHYGNVTDPPALRAAIYDLDAIVHLVAIIKERGASTFNAFNHLGTKTVATAAAQAGVRHFVHVSAIGAQDTPSYPYLYSKWQAEREVMACGIPYTVIRPSILFGEGDEFTNTLAGVVRAFPIVPIADVGANLFQPIAVEDAARCITAVVGNEGFMGKTVEIGGPEHLSYSDIVQIIARTLELRRALLPIPVSVMQTLVRVMEMVLPHPPATTEQFRMVVLPNITELDSVYSHFGFQPISFEGNIQFIKNITRWDGVRIAAGFMPAHIRRG